MGAGHGHRLRFHGHDLVHRAPAHLELVALGGFVLLVVATPREWYGVVAVHAAVLLTLAATTEPQDVVTGLRRLRMRVAVATVLARRPEILVLDELSSDLDPASRRELADIPRGLHVTLLVLTHDLPDARELSPRPWCGTTARSSPTAPRTTCSPTRG